MRSDCVRLFTMKKLFLLLAMIGFVSFNVSCVPHQARPSYGISKAKWGAHRGASKAKWGAHKVKNRIKWRANQARY